MRGQYGKDAERLGAQIGQFADKRKAQLDREQANAAKGVLVAAKLRVTEAGQAIASAE